MSTYAQRLSARLKQKKAQGQSVNTKAVERLRNAGIVVGVPLSELLAWYASDLGTIEHDGEISDDTLLAYVRDYADNHRPEISGVSTTVVAGGVPCDW